MKWTSFLFLVLSLSFRGGAAIKANKFSRKASPFFSDLAKVAETSGMLDSGVHDTQDKRGSIGGSQVIRAHLSGVKYALLTEAEQEICPHIWASFPFVAMILAIAIIPSAFEDWWGRLENQAFVSGLITVPSITYMMAMQNWHNLEKFIITYVPFVCLVWALYFVSSGIRLEGAVKPTPFNNAMILLAGSILAGFIGTVGASMLLIRFLLRNNATRRNKVHSVTYFIIAVSNAGGALTPLGDPPVFLGFLGGVDFEFTLRLFPAWAMAICMLSIAYYIHDTILLRSEEAEVIAEGGDTEDLLVSEKNEGDLRVEGGLNVLFLVAIFLVVLFVNERFEPVSSLVEHSELYKLAPCPFLITIILVCNYFCHPSEGTPFGMFPVYEVVFVYLGLFSSLPSALDCLEANISDSISMDILQPDNAFNYAMLSGITSSFIDNSAVYLSYARIALGNMEEGATLSDFADEFPVTLLGLTFGAVYMGANTYIGNAPNYLCKSLALEAGVPMPSFFGFMYVCSIIACPIFVVVCYLCFERFPDELVL